MKKHFLTLFLALSASVGNLFAETYSGTCGTDLTWTLEAGTLTIFGTGTTMDDYTYFDKSPFYVFRGDIRTISFEAPLQNIGNYAFSYCTYLTSITIPEGVTSIGMSAFSECINLQSVIIPKSLTTICEDAFFQCVYSEFYISDIAAWCNIRFIDNPFSDTYNLYLNNELVTNLTIPNCVTSINEHAFTYCSSLISIEIPNSVTSIGIRAFYNCKNLTSVTIGNSVTTISDNAFAECNNLASVKIGNSITTINDYAFYNCSSLTSIAIPESMSSISDGSFGGCSSLTKVTLNSNAICSKTYTSTSSIKSIFGSQVLEYVLGESVTAIGDYSFSGCNGMTSITLSNSITAIGDYAFRGCKRLTSINIPQGVTTIGEKTFEDCSSLTSVTIPPSISTIGLFAFRACESLNGVYISDIAAWCNISLTSNPLKYAHNLYLNNELVTQLAIPDGVKSIGKYAFECCTSLTSVTIPESVTIIGEGAFDACSNLTSIEIPNNVTTIGTFAFRDCSNLTSITIGNSVTSLGQSPFARCSNVTKVTLNSNAIVSSTTSLNTLASIFGTQVEEYIVGDNVEEIGLYAFNGSSSLTSVTIGNNVTSIGGQSFFDCSTLTSITIPESVTTIGNQAFYRCIGLTSVSIPESVTNIGNQSFYGCNSLTQVTLNSNAIVSKTTQSSSMNRIFGEQVEEFILGESVTEIGTVFKGYGSLKSITIPNSVTSISEQAFDGCGSLTSVTIPESITNIGKRTFDNCSSLTSVSIPESVTSIGEYAFENCSSLTSIVIPNSITSIDNHAFLHCSGLTSITLPKNLASIGEYTFDGCSNLTSVTIPESLTSISDGVFCGCTSLTSIVIPDNVNSIGQYAFYYCTNLQKVTLGSGISKINRSAFYNCNNLKTIHAQMENPPYIDASVFDECGDLSKIDCYVPQASLELYQNASVWKEFNLIAENNANTHTLTVNANNPQFGSVTGSGTYAEGLDVEITATPNAGYHFVCWNDGNQSATRTVTVSSDATYTALFAADVVPQEEVVTVYAEQTTATITAELIDNDDVESYRFVIYYQGAVFCTCLLDKEGQTLQVDYADKEPNSIPTRLNMPAEALNEANGLNISVSDLQRCATYQFTLDALDADGNILDRRENDFTTTGSVETTDGITVWEDELPYIWEGITFTTAGTETKTLTASTGCDSIVTFTLNVKYHDITLQDNADTDYYTQFAEDYNGHTVNTATLNRQFTQGKWSTLCLPFNVSKSLMIALGLSGRVYEFRYAEQSDDESIQMYFASAQSIEAGKGYIVNANAKLAQKISFVFPNVTINTDSDNGDITTLTGYNDGTGRGNLYLAGTLRAGVLQGSANGNTYLGLKDNQLYYPNTTTGTSIRAYRGFFRSDVPVNASRVRIIAEGETVTELEVTVDEQGRMDNGQWQNNDPSARKYIENGILYIRSNGVTYTAQGQRID